MGSQQQQPLQSVHAAVVVLGLQTAAHVAPPDPPELVEPLELDDALEACDPLELEDALEACDPLELEEPPELDDALEPDDPPEVDDALEPDDPPELDDALDPDSPLEPPEPLPSSEDPSPDPPPLLPLEHASSPTVAEAPATTTTWKSFEMSMAARTVFPEVELRNPQSAWACLPCGLGPFPKWRVSKHCELERPSRLSVFTN
jgi:hypothetical protein